MQRVLVSWSSGKDSAWMLHVLRHQPDIEIGALLTTINSEAGRVAMHAVRSELVSAQAAAADAPLWEVPLPWPCSNEHYERLMAAVMEKARVEGFTHVAFGDLFLQDVREYREQRLAGTGLSPLFPLWLQPTPALSRTMLDGGLRAIVTCADPRHLPREFAGRDFDLDLLQALPPGIDPCGERGEFHTFAWDGPMFSKAIAVTRGIVVERDGFVFADLVPAANGT